MGTWNYKSSMTSIRQLRIKASQIAIFGCKKNFFVVNKLEEFSLPAYLKLKALLAKIFLGFILSAIALWWGAPRQDPTSSCRCHHLYAIHWRILLIAGLLSWHMLCIRSVAERLSLCEYIVGRWSIAEVMWKRATPSPACSSSRENDLHSG